MAKIHKMTVTEFKARFSDAINSIKNGDKIAVTYGKKKEVIGYFVPVNHEKSGKRKLGILQEKVKISFGKDFKMTESEFLES